MLRKLSNVERELFENNKRQKLSFQQWKNREGRAVEVNKDFMCEDGEEQEQAGGNMMKRMKMR